MDRRSTPALGLMLLTVGLLGGCRSSDYVHQYAADSHGSVVASDRFGARLAVANTTRQIAATNAAGNSRVTSAENEESR